MMMRINFGSHLRRGAFWIADALRGSPMRLQLKDLQRQLSVGFGSSIQNERLKSLLAHATSTTEFYREYRGCTELALYPVIQKRQISERREAFLSGTYAGQRLPVMSTSGSTGMPMQFRMSPAKRFRQQAEMIHFSSLAGFELGMRHANIRIIRNKSPLRYWMENQVLLDPSVTSEEWLETARLKLKEPAMGFLTGYARPISVLAHYCRDKGDQPGMFALKSVVPTAEALTSSERRLIEATFGCPILNRYGSQEFGVLAQECRSHRLLHLNTASYIVEILALEEDTPVNPGQVGRVVVTDLFSHAMPLIRYDIGDLAVQGKPRCACGDPTPFLESIRGRLVEMILAANGELLSPFILVNSLREIVGIQQFRFLQRAACEYELMVVATSDFKEATVAVLLRRYLGSAARIRIHQVGDIPALPSGKRPYVVNEYVKDLVRNGTWTGRPISAEDAPMTGLACGPD